MIIKIAKKILLLLFNNKYRRTKISFYKIKRLKRYEPSMVYVFDSPIKIVDSASFLFQYNEIFIQKIYKFNSDNTKPFIIDGGSNIGLAIVYWKTLFPDSHIIGFEPDDNVFNVLDYNIKTLKLKNVEIVNKGLWDSDTTLYFSPDGSDGGRVSSAETTTKIEVISLKNYLYNKVDFLKLDIEGAEIKVLVDCSEYLKNVGNIFIEYHSFDGKNQELDIILKLLTSSGFRYYIRSTGVFSNQPFMKIHNYEGMDLQLNIFGYR
jgi:FkbM family methyltransferase